MQTDPIGYKDQMNLYAYVGNDPVNLIDPTGENGVMPSMGQMQAQAYSSQITKQSLTASLVGQENAAKESLKSISNGLDIVSLGAVATGQLGIAGAAGALGALATIGEKSIDFTSDSDFTTLNNEATGAVLTGEAVGTAVATPIEVASEVIGSVGGARGKVAEQVIKVSAEYVNQKVSEAVVDEKLKH